MSPDHPPIPLHIAEALRARLPEAADQTVAAIVVQVPSYADAFSGEMGEQIRTAVQLALGWFLELATAGGGTDAGTPIGPAIEGAYELGRGEARSGRSMDALLAAYRVGARVAWRHLSDTAVAAGLPVGSLARFAELVFAYIDQLSASSVAGHADELASTGRLLQRNRERLAQRLLDGAPGDELAAAAEKAQWAPPRTLTAVVLPKARTPGALISLDPRTLESGEEPPGLAPESGLTVLLVPDADAASRPALARSLEGRDAVLGPSRPWQQVRSSYVRVLRAVRLGLGSGGTAALDTERRLPDLVLRADDDALADLRAQALAPLADLAPGTREKLTETLRAWLLRLGRRDEVAAELCVHPQTVRYRMTQLRDLYGRRLEDPETVLQLVLALGARDG